MALYRRILEVNLTGAFLGIQAVLPGMKARGKGAIVNMSSVDGMKGANGLVAYCSSKWGARGPDPASPRWRPGCTVCASIPCIRPASIP